MTFAAIAPKGAWGEIAPEGAWDEIAPECCVVSALSVIIGCMTSPSPRPKVAVLLPCYNEEHAIGPVIANLRAALPQARIYVYDNNSRDRTVIVARDAGAIVRTERQQGKGHVVRRMFADIEADIYVLMDGDDTYEAADAPRMLAMLLEEQLDMVTGARIAPPGPAYRAGHRMGNRMLTGIVRAIFGNRISDMLSGYRVFSRRFVKSFPVLSTGFEIETEFTVHALELNMPIGEIDTAYRSRPPGTASKLHTIRDGLRIARTIVRLVKDERPLQLFLSAGAVLLIAGLGLGMPVVAEFWRTHLVPRLPTAVLAASLVMLAFLSFGSGLILDSITRGRKEMKRLMYLSVRAPGDHALSEHALTNRS